MARIGFIGLGNMGLPMAQNLIKAGHQVEGVDVTQAATDKLKAAGGAVGAEGALERADHGVGRIGRQVLVAALAVGLECQHLCLLATCVERQWGAATPIAPAPGA